MAGISSAINLLSINQALRNGLVFWGDGSSFTDSHRGLIPTTVNATFDSTTPVSGALGLYYTTGNVATTNVVYPSITGLPNASQKYAALFWLKCRYSSTPATTSSTIIKFPSSTVVNGRVGLDALYNATNGRFELANNSFYGTNSSGFALPQNTWTMVGMQGYTSAVGGYVRAMVFSFAGGNLIHDDQTFSTNGTSFSLDQGVRLIDTTSSRGSVNFDIDSLGIWSRELTNQDFKDFYNAGAGIKYIDIK